MKKEGHTFTVDLKSRSDLKDIRIGAEYKPEVQVTGSIGEIRNITFVEGVVLEVTGSKGMLRLDLPKEVLKEFRAKGRFHRDKKLMQDFPFRIKRM